MRFVPTLKEWLEKQITEEHLELQRKRISEWVKLMVEAKIITPSDVVHNV